MDEPEVEDFLAHYGVKGMKWGVRRSQAELDRAANRTTSSSSGGGGGSSSSGSSSSGSKTAATSARREKAKKVAIGTGLLIAAAGAAYVGYSLHKNGYLPVSKLNQAKSEVKKKAESIMTEPSDVIFATRMRGQGISFVRKGNLPDPLLEYDRGFGSDSAEKNVFKRYGDNNEKIAVSFDDPDGRTDHAGRVIPHEVIIPGSMSAGINTHAEAVKKAWSIVGPKYSEDYDNEINPITERKFPEWRK